MWPGGMVEGLKGQGAGGGDSAPPSLPRDGPLAGCTSPKTLFFSIKEFALFTP